MNLFYISDTHFDHENIIRYCERPFKDSQEMNEVMIERWNAVVKPQDHIWHLGDLTMHRQIGQIKYRILDRLNGHKRLILGNHDLDKVDNYRKWFEKIKAIQVHDKMIFTHIPIHPESLGKFIVNVHGHTHEKPAFGPRYINICVEHTDYAPISLEEIKQRIKV